MDKTGIVGEKIRSIRESRQLTVAELAEHTSLAVEQIERIENNIDIPSSIITTFDIKVDSEDVLPVSYVIEDTLKFY